MRAACASLALALTLALALAVAVAVAGCVNPARQAQLQAHRAGLTPLVLQGGAFELRAFAVERPPRDLLTVFIDGDGSPWVDGGRRISADPTPKTPLALALAAETSGSVLYLGRPCYFALQQRPLCSPDLWTSRRYSPVVVASLVVAANRYAAAHRFKRVLLIGYSGGGTLAALMARNMPEAVGLVTIAGNLDPAAWARLHGYLPLTGSLDPSLDPGLDPASGHPGRDLPQWHLVGGRDTNVPFSVVEPYFAQNPSARILRYPRFDHVCCWARVWPQVIGGIVGELPRAER